VVLPLLRARTTLPLLLPHHRHQLHPEVNPTKLAVAMPLLQVVDQVQVQVLEQDPVLDQEQELVLEQDNLKLLEVTTLRPAETRKEEPEQMPGKRTTHRPNVLQEELVLHPGVELLGVELLQGQAVELQDQAEEHLELQVLGQTTELPRVDSEDNREQLHLLEVLMAHLPLSHPVEQDLTMAHLLQEGLSHQVDQVLTMVHLLQEGLSHPVEQDLTMVHLPLVDLTLERIPATELPLENLTLELIPTTALLPTISDLTMELPIPSATIFRATESKRSLVSNLDLDIVLFFLDVPITIVMRKPILCLLLLIYYYGILLSTFCESILIKRYQISEDFLVFIRSE
jgi:hypothetical protein